MPNLSDYFGADAVVSGTKLTIDFAPIAAAQGFDATIASATPSQLFALLALHAFDSTNDKTEDPTYGVTVTTGFSQLVLRGEANQRSTEYTIALYQPDPNATIDPDDIV